MAVISALLLINQVFGLFDSEELYSLIYYFSEVACGKMSVSEKNPSSFDIFGLLSDTEKQTQKAEETEKAEQKKLREQLLAPTRVRDLFPEGSLCINKHTCIGVQCKLCIKACPTNALYWANGEIAVVEDLCVYCDACVLSCMVDDCIKVTRERENKIHEHFGKTRDVVVLTDKLNTEKRFERVHEVFPSSGEYCKKYGLRK